MLCFSFAPPAPPIQSPLILTQVEVATPEELTRALACDAHVIGINNRNLKDFTVDTRTTQRVLEGAGLSHEGEPGLSAANPLICALSGISCRLDVLKYRAAGCHGCLVGEALMRAADPSARIQSLRGLGLRDPLVKICGASTHQRSVRQPNRIVNLTCRSFWPASLVASRPA